MANAATLPLDILEEIFAEDTQKLHPRRMLHLASVCRHWRDIALSLPKFWSFIDIHEDTEEYVNMCCVYSKHVPLAIHFRPHILKYPRILDIVFAKHGCRVEWLTISLNSVVGLNWLRLCQKTPLPNLKSLSINISPKILLSSFSIPFSIVTLICSVSPPIPPRQYRMYKLNLMWEGLTTIRVYQLPVDQCIQLLLQCPSLAEMYCIENSLPTTWTVAHLKNLIHESGATREKLHTFRWDPAKYDCMGEWNEVVTKFKFPNLKKLVWMNARRPIGFREFLKAANRIEIFECWEPYALGLIQSLNGAPCSTTIRCLGLDFWDNGEDFLKAVVFLADKFPALRVLALRTCHMNLCRYPQGIEFAVALNRARCFSRFTWQYGNYVRPSLCDWPGEAVAEQAGVIMRWMGPEVYFGAGPKFVRMPSD